MRKQLIAFIAAILITGTIALSMFVVGVNAMANQNGTALQIHRSAVRLRQQVQPQPPLTRRRSPNFRAWLPNTKRANNNTRPP